MAIISYFIAFLIGTIELYQSRPEDTNKHVAIGLGRLGFLAFLLLCIGLVVSIYAEIDASRTKAKQETAIMELLTQIAQDIRSSDMGEKQLDAAVKNIVTAFPDIEKRIAKLQEKFKAERSSGKQVGTLVFRFNQPTNWKELAKHTDFLFIKSGQGGQKAYPTYSSQVKLARNLKLPYYSY